MTENINVGGEFETILREATASVEQSLNLEDMGWINMASGSGETITSSSRKSNLELSRLYYYKDPLAKQSIRLWTDYTFGTGMTWSTEDTAAQKVLEEFWNAKTNQVVLGARGQRLSSDKVLVDGDIFFAIFLGDQCTIRRIDPLEITEFISDPDDIETVLYYKREWTDAQSKSHIDFYRSTGNIKDKGATDSLGANITKTQDALVYHLALNTLSQRGNPLLLPALDWIKHYRRFLASRIAVMLALARFAWHTKVKGGSAAVSTIKAVTEGMTPNAGSTLLENMGADTQPIRTDSGASQAYQDGKMIKYQICAAVGIPEQYFGDISAGNFATSKTVELPMMKMFQSYQQIWQDTYQDIDEVILEFKGISPDKWYVDREFPAIAPEDVLGAATALVQVVTAIPELKASDDVKQMALLTLGINDPQEVIDALKKLAPEEPTEPAEPEVEESVELMKALKRYSKVLKESLNAVSKV